MNAASSWSALIQRYASKGVLVDTEILLLYLVGLYDPMYISRFKRTKKYTKEDFDLAFRFINQFHRVVTTPHVLAELSNWSLELKGKRVDDYFKHLIPVLKAAREDYIEKGPLLADVRLPKFGFTDLSIVEAAKRSGYLVLTADFPMAGLLSNQKCAVINFNHLRQLSWSM